MYVEYDDNILKHLHEVQLMILKDFIEISERNNIEYFVYAGTALGAIRHKGFIPWDDDIDVIMFRDQYEKFLEVMKKENSEKYDVLNMDEYEDCFLLFSKLSLKGTKVDEIIAKNTSFNLGINIDIFILDFAPSTKFKWFLFHNRCKMLHNFAYMLMIIKNECYVSNFKKILTKLIASFFKLLGISQSTLQNKYNKLIKHSKQYNERVYDFYGFYYDEPFPVSIFRPPKKVKFESIEVNVPHDYDTYLKILYGDYMTLPPEDERTNHSHTKIDFGKY